MKKYTFSTISLTIMLFLSLLLISCGVNENKSRLHLDRGVDFIYQARHEQALAELEKAVKYNPKSAEAHYYRAACKRNLKNVEGALEDYKKAIELNPEYADAYFNIASIYDYLQDRKTACFYYLKAEALGRPNTNEYTRWCK